MLKKWRALRSFSQLDLSLASNVSQRHISFLESGRAKPSRAMVLELGRVLEVPLRQQNLMLTAAGFAPIHAETDLSAPEMTAVRQAIAFMLEKQEPYPAFALDCYWNLLLSNDAAQRLLNIFIEPEILESKFCQEGKINLMRSIFHPQGLRPFVVNWDECALPLLRRVHREAIATGYSFQGESSDSAIGNEKSLALLKEITSYPDIPEIYPTFERTAPDRLLLAIHFAKNSLEFKFFSTIATLGTAYDITLQELRVECLFPADEATARNWQQLKQ